MALKVSNKIKVPVNYNDGVNRGTFYAFVMLKKDESTGKNGIHLASLQGIDLEGNEQLLIDQVNAVYSDTGEDHSEKIVDAFGIAGGLLVRSIISDVSDFLARSGRQQN